uniref:Soluble lamin-associated protein of 75 kDa-like n=1 Tax=Oncorhynchus mykiss TaxID=8022 RepID=A0A8C7QZF3_ONCMY
MEFPVDVLDSVRQEEVEQAAEGYMTQLRYVSPDKTESFTLPNHRKISIGLCNVGFVPIYGGDLKHKVMALFSPDDQLTAVALYLAGQWWSVEDILRTSDPSRTGLVKVRSLGERIVLYILNRIVYRVGEMDKPEVPFLCHGQHDFAKLLWKDGNAVGFYSVKPKDSLCNNFVTQRYQLPVMDSMFVRKCHRGNGHGLQMLEDFVDSFKDNQLGLKYPLSLTMYKAVLHAATSNGDRRSASLDHTDVSMEEDNFLDITEDVLVVNTPLKLIEALDGSPVSTRSRSSGHKKRGREETDSTEESQPLKMNRMEDAKSEPTNTAVEDGGQEEAEGRAGEESGEAEAAVAQEEMEMTTTKAQIVKMNGELTDGQREEVKDGVEVEGEAVLENRTTEEDVEEAAAEEEESIEAEDILEAAPVAPEGLAEAVEEQDPLPLVDGPASVSEEAPSPAEPPPAEPSLSGDVREEATPMEGGEVEGGKDTVVATPVASEGLAVVEDVEKEAPLPFVKEPASAPEEAPSPMEGEEVKREEVEERAMEEPEVKKKLVEVIAVDSSSQETVVQVLEGDLSYQPLEEGEEEEEEEEAAKEEVLVANEENKGVEEMENATTTEEFEERSESSDEGGKSQALWRRVGGSGPAAPERKSKRLNRVVIEQDREQPEVTVEEEEKATTTEEEEEEAVEKSWAEEEVKEEEEPQVIDQRALRRKSRPVQTPNKARGKRHGKI